MPDAVIVSTARTGLAKSWRGAFNMTHGATMAGHVVKHAIERARVDPGEIDDVLIGCAFPEGATRAIPCGANPKAERNRASLTRDASSARLTSSRPPGMVRRSLWELAACSDAE